MLSNCVAFKVWDILWSTPSSNNGWSVNAVEAFAQQDLNLSDFYAIDFVARLALGESFFFGTKVYFCESLNIYFCHLVSHLYPLFIGSSIWSRRSLVELPKLDLAWPSHLSWQVQSLFRVKLLLSTQALSSSGLLPGRSLTNLVEVVLSLERNF